MRTSAPARTTTVSSEAVNAMSKEAGITRLLRRLLTPAVILVLPVVVSAIAWSIPGESRRLRGFSERADLTMIGVLTLLVWYGLVVVTVLLGRAAGRAVQPIDALSWDPGSDSREGRFYVLVTVLSSIGVLTVLIGAGGFGGFLDALSATDANSLKESTGGGAGLSTLRYTTAIAAPLGLHRLLTNRRGLILAVVNIVLLLLTAAVASRLALLMAVVVFLFLIMVRPVSQRLRVGWIIVGAAAIFGLLTWLNYTRNARFYENLGISDPVAMSLYQALAYLGTPFQVSLGVADAISFKGATFDQPPAEGWLVLVPTFFRGEAPQGDGTGVNRYGAFVDYHSSLTTNSAFADTLSTYGPAGLAASLITVFIAAALFGHFARYRNAMAVLPGVVLYGMAEYWRILLFNQGIFVYLIIACIIVGVFVSATRVSASRYGRSSTTGSS
jgi:hypothetical protein